MCRLISKKRQPLCDPSISRKRDCRSRIRSQIDKRRQDNSTPSRRVGKQRRFSPFSKSHQTSLPAEFCQEVESVSDDPYADGDRFLRARSWHVSVAGPDFEVEALTKRMAGHVDYSSNLTGVTFNFCVKQNLPSPNSSER